MYPGSGGYPGQQYGGYPGQHPSQQPGGFGGGYMGQQPEGFPGQNPGGYAAQQMGGYPAAPPGVSPEVAQWFNTVDRDRSGKINAKELQAALVNGQGKNFSDTACQLMIGMFDRDKSGTIDISEFQALYNYINQWLNVFRTYDRDQSGSVEEQELYQALSQMGFRFSQDFVKFLIVKSDPEEHKKITVDQFIVLCIQIQRFTEAFRARDAEKKGVISIGFEDFLGVALTCSI